VRYPTGPLNIGGFTIHDSHNFGPSLNVPEALIHSSNIVTAQIADKLGGPALRRTMMQLGMNERPISNCLRGASSLAPGNRCQGDWARITTMTVSYGHGIAVTPLHLASAYAALVNGGIWRPATLQGRSGARAAGPPRVQGFHQRAHPPTAAHDRGGWHGPQGRRFGFRVGGKTGSAEPGAGGYRRTSLVATFAAFPMDKPRYVVIAMLDEPQGTAATSGQRTAAWNAAPIVGRVVPHRAAAGRRARCQPRCRYFRPVAAGRQWRRE
jgi:cell division protein FtsI (penicillin-binding protein 3)